MKPIKFTYEIKEKDYIKVNLWAALEKTPFMRLLNRYLIYGIDFIIMIIALFAGLPIEFFMFLLFIALVTLLLRFSVINQAKKKFRKNPMLQEHDITIEINENGFKEIFVNLSFDTDWSHVLKILIIQDIMVINLINSRVLFIPINAINDNQYNLLLEVLNKHLSSKQMKLPESLSKNIRIEENK